MPACPLVGRDRRGSGTALSICAHEAGNFLAFTGLRTEIRSMPTCWHLSQRRKSGRRLSSALAFGPRRALFPKCALMAEFIRLV